MRSRLPDHSTSAASDAPVATPDELGRAYESRRARFLLRIDGVLEGVLGALLILSPVIGHYAALSLPAPASQPILVVVGVLLLPLLPLLWRASHAPQWRPLFALAGANGAGALIFAGWVLFWHAAFHPAGATVVLLVAAILFVLDMLQSTTALMLR
jgi:hypothetical protein